MAEIAFLDDRHEGIDISRIIRAGGETVFAPDASVFVDDYNPVFPFPRGLDRTIDDAGWMITLIAESGEKVARDVWVLALLNNLHPRAKNPQGNSVLRLAGNRTTMTANAAPEIDHHGVSLLTSVFLVHDTDP